VKITTMTRGFRARIGLASAALTSLAMLLARCSSPTPGASDSVGSPAAVASWSVVYSVLEHPRCVNCHPSGDAPLQGDDRRAHAQNVHRGPDGKGLYALRCDACHQTENLAGAHLPPGAPRWHLPREDMPLVFEGRSSGELCRQLRDPARNGGMTPAQLLAHVDHDPLVLWGWNPGEGRVPVSTTHAEFVGAMRTWIDNGCGCPDR
jgi:hypothetical protein